MGIIELTTDQLFELNEKLLFDERPFEELTLHEKAYKLVCIFQIEVNNGGLYQFFFNYSGEYAHETVQALSDVISIKTSEMLHQAIMLFPSSIVPKNVEKRRAAIVSIDKNDLIILDNEFYKIEDLIESCMEKFVKINLKDNIVEVVLPLTLKNADNHFRNKEYDKVVLSLEAFEVHLSATSLKKLQLARKKIEANQ